jgi:protein O-GlcNAc transferase
MPEMILEQALRLAAQYKQAGRMVEAESICRQILAVQPNQPDALDLLGVLAFRSGRIPESETLFRQAIAAKPDGAGYYGNLGALMLAQGRFEESAAASREALRLQQDRPEPFRNLGSALLHMGRIEEATECLRNAVAMLPDSADLHCGLGNALLGQGDLQQAAESFRRAVAIRPDDPDALTNHGYVLEILERVDEALRFYRRALALAPDHAVARNNLGNTLRKLGWLDEALDCLQRARVLNPDFAIAHSSLVYTMLFHPRYDAAAIHAEHRLWNERHALPLRASIQPHRNDRDPDRPLRIGYVSSDFREHPVGRFLLPLLENHDRRRIEAYCYSGVQRDDEFTDRFRACAAAWRPTCGAPDAQVADLVRQDGIDILVDLALHMAGSRLLVFARKPAPVQATYLGYCGTTGLDAIDYRITDPYLDPPGTQQYYSERSVYLPHTYWCYNAPANAPDPSPPPASAVGHITFGCLNNFCKVTRPVLSAWCRLLRDVPTSRLLLFSLEGGHRQRVRDILAGEGIDPQRLSFVASQPMHAYFETHWRIDVALDPFPYNGGTTTCDALWMGVPVVSLAGKTAMGRAGLSLLSNVGLPELVAHTEEEYVEMAAKLAGDLPRLTELRRTLRQRMLASPLMDAPAFARDMEVAYRQMWRTWCAQGGLPCPK